MPEPYALGAKIDTHDKRDYKLPRTLNLGVGAPLPAKASAIDGLNLPPFDQGVLGSCTSQAGAMYYRFLSQKFHDKDFIGSRLWLYYQERKMEGDIPYDAGSQTRTIFRVLTKVGLPPEADDPYDISKFADASNDTPALDAEATQNKVGAYHRMDSVEVLKSCIASGYAFCGGLTVYEGLYYPDHGVVAPPKKGEQPIGAHELFFYKYDDTVRCNDGSRGALWFRNSWGPKWAEGGDACFPYSYFALPDVDWDGWMGHTGPPWRP